MATPPDFTTGQVLTAAQMNAVGLWLINSFTATAQTTLACDNVFSADYDNYLVVVTMRGTSNSNVLTFQYLDSTGAAVTANYTGAVYGQEIGTPATAFVTNAAATRASVGWLPNSTSLNLSSTLEIFNPYSTTIQTQHTGQHVGVSSGVANYAGHSYYTMSGAAARYRGLTFANTSGTNMTGLVRIYGINQ